ncbi:hypothetical protein SDRG_09452 [Saprolegnia diclina VS20]|uniref:Guanylate cyclase domain-containing protein n=1 Tax=Saprolegnia diclina (strain VS20) TaxID=1156394 RepID=T0RRY8_SAPDV|nr:hypothetical protein SDRG_09452 [Saprolegnia diclina VS20]EQC32922.1 hypothetical protein SDRG_09452 [Saprolegnia diclina VS20]|eukprot:XP_008613608.1 hypothetical protein SDRG_09452 [Saprolegnia diclina VS20]
MLPASVVSQLQAGRELIADEYASVTVLFCEVCDFNTISGQLDPDQVVELLNTIFSKFDVLVDYHSVHKIETIGAVYMVSGGCPDRMTNHAVLIANLALDMIAAMPDLRAHIRKTFKWAKNIGDINIRIGINTGILMAGVVGIRNPRFKLFGDTVNVSSRMESTNLPGHIQLTEATHDAIKHAYVTEHRGTIPVKGRGDMQTYFLRGHQEGVPRQAQPVMILAPTVVLTNPSSIVNAKPGAVAPLDPAAPRGSVAKIPDLSKRTLNAIGYGAPPTEVEGRTAFMKLLRKKSSSSSMLMTLPPSRDLVSEHKQNTLRESTAAFYTPENVAAPSGTDATALMELPADMTKRNVFFYINTDNTLELMYRKENEKRWMRFFRASILLCILVKPVQAMYSSVALLNGRQFQAANILFIINICCTMPVCSCFLLFTFTETFLKYRQLSSVVVLLLISAFWNTELIAMQSRGYAYISTLVLYQCHFSMLAFVFRFMAALVILVMYLVANIALSSAIVPGQTASESSRDMLLLCLRNAFYVIIFFVPQIWVVFTCEFKERVNHFRDLVLNAQQVKLVEEQNRVDKLLRNLLPESIVNQLKASPEVTIAETFENVTILFTDMVNFTAYSSRVSAMELVQFLNDMYTRFDTISEKRDLYKVEIIGDAYFVVGGCPLVTNNDAIMILNAGLDMLNTLPVLRRNSSNPNLNIRIGVHSGRVVAGVVGIKDPRYHLFGETVAIAQSLESSGVPGRIHLSETTYTRIKNTDPNAFKFEYHKMLNVSGHNTKLRTYFVT